VLYLFSVKKALVILLLFVSVRLFATHIVGGELIYDFLGKDANGKDIYRITLKVYRDCVNGQAPFDGPFGGAARALLTIIGNGRDTLVDIGAPVITKVPPSINSKCMQSPYTCVEEGIYTYTLVLPPATGGYSLIYQRCCRNNTIVNLIRPGDQGSTYYTHIPGPEAVAGNSSPRFKKFPPLFLCNNLPFYFDHAATDPDGDILLYGLAGSFNGLDACCPALGSNPSSSSNCMNLPSSCPKIAPPPPYAGLNYSSPFNATYPVASNPSLTIDPITGKLTGKPNMLGQFVVCIEVREFRNGQLIGVHFRDFQFNIASCQVSVLSDLADQVYKCVGNLITFTNQSVSNTGDLTFKWDFGVPEVSDDTSNVTDPTFFYKDTGQYVVTLIGNPGKECSDTVRKFFYVYPVLDVSMAANAPQCLKNNSFNFDAGGTFRSECKFDWTFGPAATPSVDLNRHAKNISFDKAGKYYVMLRAKQFICTDSIIDTVRVIPRPLAEIGTPPTGTCMPATITFSNFSKSSEPIRHYWTFNNGFKSENKDPVQTFYRSGNYSATLTVISDAICKDTSIASISHVTIFPKPVAGFTFYPRITTILDPLVFIKSTSEAGLAYDYDFGDGTSASYHNVEHVYYDYGNYILTQYVTNEFGCKDSAQDIVQILPEHRFWIPSAFTPNNDSKNDVFSPVLIGVSQYELQVFDRWGKLLWETQNPLEGWNGKYRGEECKQDVYVWKVRYKDVLHNETFNKSGHVTLVKDL
jgi:gliding motility-associated-like protein